MEKLNTILLVEDNQNDIELILEALSENHFANNIFVVNDGAEALDYLYKRDKFADRPNGNPSVIFLDIKMPKVNGLEVLKEIKNDEKLKTIPVVMLTSSREEQDLIESYKLGVNAYVVKPVDFIKFIEAVKQLGFFWVVLNELPKEI